MLKHKLVDFIIQFMEEVDKEISEMKLFVSLGRLGCWSVSLTQMTVERKSKIRCGVFPNTCESYPYSSDDLKLIKPTSSIKSIPECLGLLDDCWSSIASIAEGQKGVYRIK
jgi:hypothetical protein